MATINPILKNGCVIKKKIFNMIHKNSILRQAHLLIQFYDRRQNRSIWQGYATTMYGSIDFKNNRHLKNAVISILDKYRFWAEGFLEGGNIAQEKDL
jgi:hypothetical protein